MENFITLNIINFADMSRREGWNFMRYEENFVTIKFIWHTYLISNLDNCAQSAAPVALLGKASLSKETTGLAKSTLVPITLMRIFPFKNIK